MSSLAIYTLVLASVLLSFTRSDFVNVLFTQLAIGVAGLFFLYTSPRNVLPYKVLTGAIVVSLLYDLLWLVNYTSNWLGGNGSPEDNVRRLAVLFSFIVMALKIPVGALIWKNSINLS